jgi:hypothetical protein
MTGWNMIYNFFCAEIGSNCYSCSVSFCGFSLFCTAQLLYDQVGKNVYVIVSLQDMLINLLKKCRTC